MLEAGTAGAEKQAAAPGFGSAEKLREVLTEFLTRADQDPELGRRLRLTGTSFRFVFPDRDLALDIAPSESEDHQISWSFAETSWSFAGAAGKEPALTLEMDSDVANRYLQGRENLAIAMARGRIRCVCNARAALELLPISGALSRCYRQVLERLEPQLLLD